MSRAMQFDVVANDKASATMAGVEKSMVKFGKSVGSSMTVAAGKVAAVVATIKAVSATINEMGNVADEAARMGMTVEAYSKMKTAAEEYGSSIEEIAKAQKDVNKLLDAAATKGAGPEMETLKALGFSEKDVLNRTIKQAEVWERLGEAIKGASTEEEKFAVASRVLGDKISTSMVPVLENYKDFNSLMENTKTISSENADNLDRLGDALNRIASNFRAAIGNIAGQIAGKIVGPAPEKPVQTAQESAQGAVIRKALLAVGKKADTGEAQNVSSMMAIGGASFRGFNNAALARPIEEQQLAELKTIAANTTNTKGIMPPSPGQTDMTKVAPISGTESTFKPPIKYNPPRMKFHWGSGAGEM